MVRLVLLQTLVLPLAACDSGGSTDGTAAFAATNSGGPTVQASGGAFDVAS